MQCIKTVFKDVFFREEMLNLLKTALFSSGVEEEADEGIKDLIEMTMKKMDDDKDGKVSFEDFQICVKNNPLMLEAFGPCLPTGKVIGKYYWYISSSCICGRGDMHNAHCANILPITFTGWRTILQQHLGSSKVEMEGQVQMPIVHPFRILMQQGVHCPRHHKCLKSR